MPDPIAWRTYLAQVTKFERSQLLLHIAAASNSYRLIQQTKGTERPLPGDVQPFALAAIARDVILDGYSSAALHPLPDDVRHLCRVYMNLEDPIFSAVRGPDATSAFLVRMAYEQFSFQQHFYFEFCRSFALLSETADMVGTSTMTEVAWRASLGCSLKDYLRLVFLLISTAANNSGRINVRDLLDPELRRELRLETIDDIAHVIRSKLAADIEDMRADPGNSTTLPQGYERYRYNPLLRRPLLHQGADLLVPSVQLLEQKCSTNGLYYERVSDPDFTDELGEVFEAYVGRQLMQLHPTIARVEEKLVYDKGNKESVDWFVVFDEVVLLVEVKLTRMPIAARLGAAGLFEAVDRTLGYAFGQVATTARLIQDRAVKEFASIPNDRPMVGIVVTLEPYWLIWGPSIIPSQPSNISAIPVFAYELESLVSAALSGNAIGPLLKLASARDVGSRSFAIAFEGVGGAPNPLLDSAFESILGT